ncbi:replication protein A 70 kDa DNA-binding subunit B [Tanacetum coccineum]
MVGSIGEVEKHGWAYLTCKKCGNIAKQIDAEGINWWNCKLHGRITDDDVVIMYRLIVRVMDDTGSASLLHFDNLVFKLSLIESYTLINQYGEHYDEYFPVELNRIVGKKLLFRFQYNDLNISNNNHSKQFTSANSIPLNFYNTPNSAKGFASSESESSSSESGKRTIINLDNYNEEEIENQLNQKVKTIRSDNGTEFKNKDVIEFCWIKGDGKDYILTVTTFGLKQLVLLVAVLKQGILKKKLHLIKTQILCTPIMASYSSPISPALTTDDEEGRSKNRRTSPLWMNLEISKKQEKEAYDEAESLRKNL